MGKSIYKSCTMKARYEKSESAIAQLLFMRNKHHDSKLLVYWCEFCYGYHLGHGKPREFMTFPDGWDFC